MNTIQRRIAMPVSLFFALIANSAAHAYFVITFPALGREWALSDFNSSLILSLPALVMMVAAPFWGWLCERWGRRRVILSGLVAATLSSTAMSAITASNLSILLNSQMLFVLLLALRFFHSSISAGVQPAAQAVIADRTKREQRARAMGMMGAAFGLGTIGGGMLAMVSGSHYLSTGFLILAALLSLALAILTSVFEDTSHSDESPKGGKLPVRETLPFLLTTVVGLTVYSALQQVIAWVLQDSFGMQSHQSVRFTGAIMMATMLVMIGSQSVLLTKLNWQPSRLRQVGAVIAAMALLAASMAPVPVLLLVAIALMGCGLGLLLPGNLAMLSLAVGPQQQGRIAGLNGMCQGLGLALGPVCGSLLFGFSPMLPFIVAGLLMLLIGVHAMLINRSSAALHS